MAYTFPIPGWKGVVQLHHGLHVGASDLFAALGSRIVSVADGVVTYAGSDAIGGNNLMIRGDDGLVYYYAHLRDLPIVRAGQRVTSGTLVGFVGETGNAAGTGPHLHIGIGKSIINGTGASGGAGAGFDAVAFLRALLAGASVDPLPTLPDGGGNAPGATPLGTGITLPGGGNIPLPDAAAWQRVGAVVLGALLIVGGLVAAIVSTPAGQGATKAVAGVASKGVL